MADTLRLSRKEQDDIYKKCIEVNKILINRNLMPIRESEMIHEILAIAIRNVRVDEKGQLYIDV